MCINIVNTVRVKFGLGLVNIVVNLHYTQYRYIAVASARSLDKYIDVQALPSNCTKEREKSSLD